MRIHVVVVTPEALGITKLPAEAVTRLLDMGVE
jgi:hypothetical protein